MEKKITCIFLIGSVMFLFTAGCLAPGIPALNATDSSPDTLYPNQPVLSPDMAYWIHINPLEDYFPGDPVVIQGTTNLPVGDHIDVAVYSAGNPTERGWKADCLGEGGVREVFAVGNVSGSGDQGNTWSLDLSSQNLCPDWYNVDVYPRRNSSAPGTARFELAPVHVWD
nr:hypothetical protein [uncultured Methanoregula sp.]